MKRSRMIHILKRKGRKLGQIALMLLMVLSLFVANAPVACAEGGAGSAASGTDTTQKPVLQATEGSASLAEVINNEDSNTQSSPESFSNDLPSVTITETFTTTDTPEKTPTKNTASQATDETT